MGITDITTEKSEKRIQSSIVVLLIITLFLIFNLATLMIDYIPLNIAY